MAKLDDIIAQIQSQITKYTNDFNSESSITGASISGGTMTLRLSADVDTDTYVNVSGVYGETAVSGVTANTVADQYDLGFATEHDLTYSDDEKDYGEPRVVEFVGDFEGQYPLIDVMGATGITIESDTVPTGSFYLLEDRGYSGRKAVTFTDPKTICYTVDQAVTPHLKNATVQSNIRIDGASSPEDIADLIENEAVPLTQKTLFVIINPTRVSKDRNVFSDSISRKEWKDDLQTEVVQTFSVFCVIPTQNDITPRSAINYSYTLRGYLVKCLHGAQFDSGFGDDGKFLCGYIGDDGAQYNKAYYIHRYDFETVFNIENSDALAIESARAFREFEIGVKLEHDNYVLTKKTIAGDIE